MAKKFLDLEVKNSARQLRIDVSPNDIKKGKKLDPTSCAAAQCLLRTTNAEEAYVHRGVCYLKIGKVWQKYITSSGLRMETIIFDRGGTFMPGEYDLNPVPLRMIVPKSKRSSSKGMKPKEAARAYRRRVIPGVRRSARQGQQEED
jgi:hypothetical protein